MAVDSSQLAETAAIAENSSVLPDDDDVLYGSVTGGGGSLLPNIDRMIQTLTVEQFSKVLIPGWWSRARDKRLRTITLKNDYIGIGLYNAITKVTGIIPFIVPDVKMSPDNIRLAAMTATKLLQNAWLRTVPGMLFDVMSQDNGGFLEIVGGGGTSWKPLPPVNLGSITLPAVGLKNIDSQRVVRTGNPKYPIKVLWNDGQEYVMHHTRVIDFTQLPSTNPDMNGVGLCAVSRVINSMMQGGELDHILLDILSTGLTGEIILASPFESDDLEAAFKKAQERSYDPTKSNMNRYVFVGVQNFDGKLQVVRIPLRRVPEGMTKQDMAAVLMQMIAATLSIDFREIWPSPISGNAKSDATQHDKKTRSKFIKEWTLYMKQQLSFKFSPLGTNAVFDWADPAEVQEILDGRKSLAETHKIELENGTINLETALKQMAGYGYIDEDDIRPIMESNAPPQQTNNSERLTNLFVPQIARNNKQLTDVRKQDEQSYLSELEVNINGYRDGTYDRDEFIYNVSEMNRRYVIEAFLAGSKKTFGDFNDTDFDALENFLDYLDDRINALEKFLSSDDTSDDMVLYRMSLWETTIERAYYGAFLYRDDDPYLMWVYDPVKDHCVDCIEYNGQVKRKSEWVAIGIYPRSSDLACTGIHCGCRYIEV